MKRLIYLSFTMLTIVILSLNNVKSQSSGIVHANKQLRALFGNLNLPPNPKLFLYDMAAHVTDSCFFQTNCPDTIDTDTWYKVYEEMYNSAYDTLKHAHPKSVYFNANSFYSDTIPFGIMNYAFYKLKPNALTSNIYFNFDTVNNKLTDKYPRPGFPYIDSNMFAASALVRSNYFSNPVFRIDPDFILYDHHNNIKFSNECQLIIDFDDGKGWVQFDPNKVTHHVVNYPSSGSKFIKTAIRTTNTQSIIHSSISKFSILSSQQVVKPNSTISVPGLNVGVYSGCNSQGIKSGKLVIYLPGFDILDFLPSTGRDVTRIYAEMISNNKIVQLKNLGYNFVVVDYKRSTIDMRFNALYVVNLLEKLKCSLDKEHQFVIMGESMGGLIGRYAMTYMESTFYDNQNTSPFFVDAGDVNNTTYLRNHPGIFNLPQNWCMTDKRHNTRLLLTLDTPHQGANIPLSVQHAYRSLINFMSKFTGFNFNTLSTAMNLFIDGQAAQQMLIYHIDTKQGSNYDSHPDKYNFFNQLSQLGDYPKYCKVTALSNGSLSGARQTNYYTFQDRTPGDRLIDFDADIYLRILGRKFPLLHAELDSRTNMTGQIYKAQLRVFSISLKLYWFGVKFFVGQKNIINDAASADVLPYCVSAGGYTGEPVIFNPNPSIINRNLSNNWILNVFAYSVINNGSGCQVIGGHFGWNGFASLNANANVCSDGLHFALVPVQSALDYGTLGNNPLTQDIENENINSKLAKVKPDAIIGYPGSGIMINRNHLGTYTNPFRNIDVYNITQQPAPNKKYTYYSCINYNDDVQRGLINMEIGDEELYLENAELNWSSLYQAEFDINVNERNPIYEYPSGSKTSLYYGVYSKEKPFIINQYASATFMVDPFNSPTKKGLTYLAPHTGLYFKDDEELNICCIDFIGSRLKDNQKSESRMEYLNELKLFPNPNNGNELVIRYRLDGNSDVRLDIFNSIGIKVLSKSLKTTSPALETTQVIPLNLRLKNGIYFVRLSNGVEDLTKRLIISQ